MTADDYGDPCLQFLAKLHGGIAALLLQSLLLGCGCMQAGVPAKPANIPEPPRSSDLLALPESRMLLLGRRGSQLRRTSIIPCITVEAVNLLLTAVNHSLTAVNHPLHHCGSCQSSPASLWKLSIIPCITVEGSGGEENFLNKYDSKGSPKLSHRSKSETKLYEDDSDRSKLSKKESLKEQKKNYRREKKRAAKELLNTLKDPSVVVLRDWLKIRGTLKGWQKYWCVLKPGVLIIYKGPKHGAWVGTILLNACEIIERPSKMNGFCFKVFHPLDQSIWASKGPKGETVPAITQPLPTSYLILRAATDADVHEIHETLVYVHDWPGRCWMDAMELSLRCSSLLMRSMVKDAATNGQQSMSTLDTSDPNQQSRTLSWNESDIERHFQVHLALGRTITTQNGEEEEKEEKEEEKDEDEKESKGSDSEASKQHDQVFEEIRENTCVLTLPVFLVDEDEKESKGSDSEASEQHDQVFEEIREYTCVLTLSVFLVDEDEKESKDEDEKESKGSDSEASEQHDQVFEEIRENTCVLTLPVFLVDEDEKESKGSDSEASEQHDQVFEEDLEPPKETVYRENTCEELGQQGGASQTEEVADENKSIIWTLIKQVRPGMDLSRVVLPTFILEPRSFLDKLSDYYYHADLLSDAVTMTKSSVLFPDLSAVTMTTLSVLFPALSAVTMTTSSVIFPALSAVTMTTSSVNISLALSAVNIDDPFGRMKQIVRWYLSGFYKKPKGLKKPYNPILGETFRCMWPHPQTGSKTFFIAEQVSHHPPVSAFYVTNRQDGFCINGSILCKSKFYGNSLSAILDGTACLTLLNRGEDYAITMPYVSCKGILYGTMTMEMGGKVSLTCDKTGYRTEIEFKLKPFLGGSDASNQITGKIKLGKETLATLEGHWDQDVYITEKSTGSDKTEVFWSVTDEVKSRRLKRQTVRFEDQGDFESEKLWQHVSAAISACDQNKATNEKYILEEQQRKDARERKEKRADWVPKLFEREGAEEHNWIYKHIESVSYTCIHLNTFYYTHLDNVQTCTDHLVKPPSQSHRDSDRSSSEPRPDEDDASDDERSDVSSRADSGRGPRSRHHYAPSTIEQAVRPLVRAQQETNDRLADLSGRLRMLANQNAEHSNYLQNKDWLLLAVVMLFQVVTMYMFSR
uniref:Oxysterol-binding protein n=1 Tax=Branchiostoma floridae TaxID=7739 RepID=C3ZKD7_BRAFL|eukprot:XP_002591025.1 hypothetical protein BRAFLDRAFT_69422 [Branchiostoma floridae]